MRASSLLLEKSDVCLRFGLAAVRIRLQGENISPTVGKKPTQLTKMINDKSVPPFFKKSFRQTGVNSK